MSSEQYLPGMAIKVKAPFYIPLLAEERLVETQVQGVTLVRVDACLCRDEFCLCRILPKAWAKPGARKKYQEE